MIQLLVLRKDYKCNTDYLITKSAEVAFRLALQYTTRENLNSWRESNTRTKFLGVKNENELLDIYSRALENNFPALIQREKPNTEKQSKKSEHFLAIIGPITTKQANELLRN